MSILFTSMLALAACAAASPQLDARGPGGINNQGSGNCAKKSMPKIKEYIMRVPDTQIYHPGFHIACSDIVRPGSGGGGTCAFLQKGAGPLTGKQVKELITLLANHPNTEGCGSVPVSLLPEYGSINELDKMGMLTVNYVRDTDNPCPPGPCDGTPTKITRPRPQPTCTPGRFVDLREGMKPVANDSVARRAPSRIYGRAEVAEFWVQATSDPLMTTAGQQLTVSSIVPIDAFQSAQLAIEHHGYDGLVPNLANFIAHTDETLTGGVHERVADVCSNIRQTLMVEQYSGNPDMPALTEGSWRALLGAGVNYFRRRFNRVQGITIGMTGAAGVAFSINIFFGVSAQP